ncbi:PHB depolymerase family esterase [Rhodoplanes sp.]|uniref:extracellular catalytic domain type 1 short-chain-length polyhydroxyalkanoate depolymerase n=1 Tax=Rhodoplanes sp. TaxID=1968906 RepID=UPI0025E2ECA4|nr:PHB depolymerase family esterase [Rhodoplanes sp.]
MRTIPGGVAPRERPPGPTRLQEVTDFGANPGNLRMCTYVPRNPQRALVVVLHGCTQTAASYDLGAGWSTLADRYGFMLLLPEQRAENNPKTCFNWFRENDITRGQGEAASIRQMITTMAIEHDVDPRRVFITGLSAGGGMTAVMLATYPEVFAAGAIIAGLPYRSATSTRQALESMFRVRVRTPREWGDLVRAASPHAGPWPRVSVWHGGADTVVKPKNAEELLKQWTDVHGLGTQATRTETVDGYPRHVWTDASGEVVIESYIIPLMPHGTPLASGDGDESYGVPGEYLIEVGISSSYHIACFWGLTEKRPAASRPRRTAESSAATQRVVEARPAKGSEPTPAPVRAEVIEQPGPGDVPPPRAGRSEGPGESAGAGRDKARKSGVSAFVEGAIKRALEAAGMMKRR